MQSGPGGSLAAGYVSALVAGNFNLSGATTTVSRYDPDGRVQSQHVVNGADASQNNDTVYSTATNPGYDAAGNLTGYTTTQGLIRTVYTVASKRLEGYKEDHVDAVTTNLDSGKTNRGTTTDVYDANGFLVAVNAVVNGNADAANSRTLVNDANGHVLTKTQQGHALDEMVVNNQVIGRYGTGIDPSRPTNSDGSPNYVVQGNFDLAYEPVTNTYPAAATGQYPVQAGDTLQAIAQAAYGDASLWYLIADANGLSGNQDLKVGVSK